MNSLPLHPVGLDWPTTEWPTGGLDVDVESAADADVESLSDALAAIADMHGDQGVSLATLVVHRGLLVAEQYGVGTDTSTTMISWSMAKSVTHALFGLLVGDGFVDIDAPAAVPEFIGTAKAAITVRDLLEMKSGLEFVEDYDDPVTSHCLAMLFGAGADDCAHYAASRQLLHPPGSVWNYASGTTNILSRLAGRLLTEQQIAGLGADAASKRAAMESYLQRRLFGAIGMTSAVAKFDASGTFVGSSYVYATARDFARFGYLYLRDGVWDDKRLLPEGWVDQARSLVAIDEDPPHFGYGAHWWIWRDQPGSLAAHGYEGQYIVVVPERDLVVVHLGRVPSPVRPPLLRRLSQLVEAFPVRH